MLVLNVGVAKFESNFHIDKINLRMLHCRQKWTSDFCFS